MKETIKSLVNKSQVDAVLDTPDKNRAKIKKLETSDLVILLIKVTLILMDARIVSYFSRFLKSFITPTGSERIPNGYQKNVLNHLLH